MSDISTEDLVQTSIQLVPRYFEQHFAEIPTLDAHANEVMRLASQALHADISEMVRLIRVDPSLTAALLHLSTTPMYRRSQAVHSVEEIIVWVGAKEAYATIVSTAVRSLFEPKLSGIHQALLSDWQRLQQDAVVCAFACSWMAERLGQSGQYDLYFLGGMFHEIGRLGILYCLGALMLNQELPMVLPSEALAQISDCLHQACGQRMQRAWRLPAEIIALSAQAATATPTTRPAQVVRLVSQTATALARGTPSPGADPERTACLQALGLAEADGQALETKLLALNMHVEHLFAAKPPAAQGSPSPMSG